MELATNQALTNTIIMKRILLSSITILSILAGQIHLATPSAFAGDAMQGGDAMKKGDAMQGHTMSGMSMKKKSAAMKKNCGMKKKSAAMKKMCMMKKG